MFADSMERVETIASFAPMPQIREETILPSPNPRGVKIKEIFYRAAMDIGVESGTFSSIAHLGSLALFEQYKEKCEPYEN